LIYRAQGEDARLPIGIFDSGVGGLTVLSQLRNQLPNESVLYFGDTARVPYGPRPAWEIELFVREILDWLLIQPVKMILMACNTSSALILDKLRPEIPVPMLGLVLPGARWAVQQLQGEGERIAVFATEATIKSQAYQQALHEALPQAVVAAVACPEFVPLIEAGAYVPTHPYYPRLFKLVRDYLSPLSVDALIYGCTHYPLLEPILQELLGERVLRIDPAVPTVAACAQELTALGLRHSGPAHYRFCVSGDPFLFQQSAGPWLPPSYQLEQVQLRTAAAQPEE